MNKIIFDEHDKLADPEELAINFFIPSKMLSGKHESYKDFLFKVMFGVCFFLVFVFILDGTFPKIIDFFVLLAVFLFIAFFCFLMPYMVNYLIKEKTLRGILLIFCFIILATFFLEVFV